MAKPSLFDLGKAGVISGSDSPASGNSEPETVAVAADGTGSGPEESNDATAAAAFDIGERDPGTGEPDPAAPLGYNKDGTPRKRRGRKPGQTIAAPRKGRAEKALDLTATEGLLLSIHAMGAALLQEPTIGLTQPEAKKLAEAISVVQSHYPTAALDPKVMAWIGLASTAAFVYGPRAAVVIAKRKKPKPVEGAPDNVVRMEPQKKSGPKSDDRKDGPVTPSQLYGPYGMGAE